MTAHSITSRNEWLAARKELLQAEKHFTRLRDELSARRRALPWVRIDKTYTFDTSRGKETLSQLFGDRNQLVVYHFMFGPDWEVGCKSCAFWADSFDGIVAHLRQRDVSFAAISRASLGKLQAFARRLGWSFEWASALESDFNFDFGVSFGADAVGRADYNYRPLQNAMSELPGISVFAKDEHGALFHTYSTYGRGLDLLNTAYNYLDLVPKGRDEDELPGTMTWVKLRDLYER
jgi:predicted dithiol-disulfide oxidoreductase (DUF899 family)